MKYAFMTFSCPELALDEALATAARHGYDGIEPRAVSDHKHGVELTADAAQRSEIKKKAAESGIALCCIATSCRYADPAVAPKTAEETRDYIDLAADVGCPRLRVFGGAIPEGVTRLQATDALVEAFKSVAEHAEKRGVIVCMETHDHWCNPDHVAEVMRRVDHPAIAVNWDIMHPIRRGGATMDSAFETLRPWIKHCHFHDGVTEGERNKLVPVGEGIIDHRTAVKRLLATGYENYMSGEWINWKPYDEYLASELAAMKGYESEND